jgi:hypothetical protein|tara:strand:- start:571 stop:1173 length:603 start_codon:yes stop_codon:yes gene_type:complete
MDNLVLPYKENNEADSSSDSDSSSASDEENSHLLTSNIGVLYKSTAYREPFIDSKSAQDYETKRNLYFTPEITKRIITVDLPSSTSLGIESSFGLSPKNIIGLKMLKSSFVGDGGTTKNINLIIPEIPDIICEKIIGGAAVFARIPIRKENDIPYTHQFLELAMIDRYFYPITIDSLTFNLSVNLTGYVTIEISYLNDTM